ncbi:MAG: hypothetical protein SVU69_03865 [Pseudomonadota bacterium]|nr:hypothetical protein [Pseudomonadota bacterium]
MINTARYGLWALIITWAIGNASVVWADLTAQWEMPSHDREFQVEYLDDNHVRMTIEDDLYMLLLDGRMYLINGDSVLDVEAFRDRVSEWSVTQFIMSRVDERAKMIPEPEDLVDTGRTENWGGVSGRVYEAELTHPESGETERREYVLTQDPRLVTLRHAMQRFSDNNTESLESQRLERMQSAFREVFGEDVALLRYDQRYRLKQISEEPIDPTRLQLPESATIKDMPGFGDMLTLARLALPLAMD